MFSKLIEKPKMQEKFLKKPPPRYVYDMIIATMGVTGFPKGLFTDDEMNPKFFDEVRALIYFIILESTK
jgi:TRAF3-interacting protein 1